MVISGQGSIPMEYTISRLCSRRSSRGTHSHETGCLTLTNKSRARPLKLFSVLICPTNTKVSTHGALFGLEPAVGKNEKQIDATLSTSDVIYKCHIVR